jgi:predicted acetyltransferase
MWRVPDSAPEVINPVPVDEIPAWARAMATTFLRDPHDPGGERHIQLLTRAWEPERAWGVRDGGRWVATLRSERRALTVPGLDGDTCELPAHALTNVTVAATHRRRGLMARMLDGSLQEARQRGEPVSILIAAEWPIYGRFGYAPATLGADYVFRRTRAGATLSGEPARVRQVERDEFGELASTIYAAARRRRAGQIDRPQWWWNSVLGRDGIAPSPELAHNWLVHEGEDGPDGLVAWKAVGDFGLVPPLGKVEVWDLASATDAAYRDLWAYLSGIDVVDEVALRNRPVDEPVRWLLHDGRTLVMTQQVDFLWLRVLDVAAALSARRYATAGELVLEVTDGDAGGPAAGRFHVTDDGEQSYCEPAGGDPDLEITQRALASIYLGGFRLRQLPASAVQELTPGALARADLMFSTPLAPWNGTWF